MKLYPSQIGLAQVYKDVLRLLKKDYIIIYYINIKRWETIKWIGIEKNPVTKFNVHSWEKVVY